MIGALASRAASRAATTVEEEVTLIAGIAYLFSCAWLKRARTSSPTICTRSVRTPISRGDTTHDAGLAREDRLSARHGELFELGFLLFRSEFCSCKSCER